MTDIVDFVLEKGKEGVALIGGEGLLTFIHQIEEFIYGCEESFGVS